MKDITKRHMLQREVRLCYALIVCRELHLRVFSDLIFLAPSDSGKFHIYICQILCERSKAGSWSTMTEVNVSPLARAEVLRSQLAPKRLADVIPYRSRGRTHASVRDNATPVRGRIRRRVPARAAADRSDGI
ncbi:hypothetical protein EVAR_40917_1 [Eumeta japonica]|uniref:Uncharacterized protein n=1 Tax=Eumeta variegata TaxID=151549 RepID=A0A4C1X5B9_EUMVA|nr:hypothetical protein EVAR_40917_1 [Eumeta japonica]